MTTAIAIYGILSLASYVFFLWLSNKLNKREHLWTLATGMNMCWGILAASMIIFMIAHDDNMFRQTSSDQTHHPENSYTVEELLISLDISSEQDSLDMSKHHLSHSFLLITESNDSLVMSVNLSESLDGDDWLGKEITLRKP